MTFGGSFQESRTVLNLPEQELCNGPMKQEQLGCLWCKIEWPTAKTAVDLAWVP